MTLQSPRQFERGAPNPTPAPTKVKGERMGGKERGKIREERARPLLTPIFWEAFRRSRLVRSYRQFSGRRFGARGWGAATANFLVGVLELAAGVQPAPIVWQAV